MSVERKWWHQAIGYQIYPKSFQDTNDDGVGDIPGITQHLVDLVDLGVNVIWISPVNTSPMLDNGYDIADYYQIDPAFGTNKDFAMLIQVAKEKNIKVLMDLVINHTSTEHEWFKKAMADLESEYADYFVIKEGIGNNPPNNWRSIFGGSAWEKIAGTNKYYLHLFTVGQPDLNWENPQLRRKLYEIIDYWLNQGVAGFRIDAIAHIKKIYSENNLPADGPDGLVTTWEHYRNATGIGDFLAEMRDTVFAKQDILTIAEMDVPNSDNWEEYFGEGGYFSSIFDFYHTAYSIQDVKYRNNAKEFVNLLKKQLFKKQTLANDRVFFTNFLENHDLPRMPDRLIPKAEINFNSISAWNMSYFFLRGIPVIYQGQEIGMQDYPKESIADYVDLATHNSYHDYLLSGMTPEQALAQINRESRENSRTPMQWSNCKNAGFSETKPWFAVNSNYSQLNYEAQKRTPTSLLNFFKKMIAVRKQVDLQELMICGRSIPVLQDISGVIAYYREKNGERLVLISNVTNESIALPLQKEIQNILLINYGEVIKDGEVLELQPYQSILYKEQGTESLEI
ncbi:glycosyl hydrolase [Enterococcus saigonensis]|uniref:Glycosyl hydrolase n=1 Tax=Enterococcus saigonensis TaxID=1805431 RepID=A0A679IS23_9ENTE|nr:alpha-glucosidase [Enterococcus saigonensis]BCA86207.1 glycosyl hydrolase [Enterococcus saigonensis]